MLIPIDNDGNLLFVRQYRHAVGKDLLELPAGTRDGDEPFEECAAREIREETGMQADKLQKVGEFYLAPGYSSEFMVVFLATGLKDNPLDADDDEFLQVEKIPLKQAIEMAERGRCARRQVTGGLVVGKTLFTKCRTHVRHAYLNSKSKF